MINEARALLTRARAHFFSWTVFGERRESTESARAHETNRPPRFPPLLVLRLSASPYYLLAVFDRFENQCAARSTAARGEKSLRVSLHASQRRLVAYLQISFCQESRAALRSAATGTARATAAIWARYSLDPPTRETKLSRNVAYTHTTRTRGMNGERNLSFFFFFNANRNLHEFFNLCFKLWFFPLYYLVLPK